jgi:tripartite-type tricarboxylate transporter receptor subunit TctC
LKTEQQKEGRMRQILALMVGLLGLLMVGSPAAQTSYPEKPIRIVVGFSPVIPMNTLALLLGQDLAKTLGKPVIIHNVTGGGGIAADRVAKATPDGYTLGLLSQTQLVTTPNMGAVVYHPVKDFTPISQITVLRLLLVVHNTVPVKSVEELVALARAQPGALTFASGGNGSTPHMAGELFKSVAGLDIRHIPFKGVPTAIQDLLAGRVTMMFSGIGVAAPLVREEKLRALAVTSLRRSSAAPELPTIAESGYPGFQVTQWYGLFAPARTPATIIGRLHLETVKALAQSDLRAKFTEFDLVGNSPEEFAAFIKSEIPKWAKVIQDSGIKPD